MKRLALACLSLLFIFITNAQDKIPSFGKIDKADLEMKDCDFDPGSEAVVLIDQGEIAFNYVQNVGWQSITAYRVRIKVLKESAIHRSEIKIHYYAKNRMQEVSNVSGVSFNLDASGNIAETRMEKKAVFDKAIDKSGSEVSFALPDVRIGTVFEYKYKVTSKSYSYIPSWNFQQSIPVRYSEYSTTIPEYFQFTMQATNRQEMIKNVSKYSDGTSWYVMHNVPGLKDEPFSSGKKDYIQRIDFQLSKIEAPAYNYYEVIRTTWPKMITELLEDEDFGLAIKKNIRGTADLDAQLSNVKTVKEKVRIVYNYVQANMQWNEEYNKYSENGIKDAWDKKNGNIADINFILIRLLRDAGLDATPVLASTKNNGAINTFFPFLNQFNCVLAYVKDGDEIYIMNAADKYNPYYLLPNDVLNTNALLVDKNNGGLIQLVSDKKYSSGIYFHCNADAAGKLTGEAGVSSLGYARNTMMAKYKTKKDRGLFEENDGIDIKIDSISVNNEKDELLPLEHKLSFSGSLQSSGDYLFLPCTLFAGLEKNPFIAESRVMDIDFYYPKSYVISGTYALPDDYIVNELPKNTKMLLPDTSILLTRIVQHDGNIISILFKLDFNSSGFTAEGYPYIKEFYKKMYEILDERIVLKKK